MAKVTIKQGQPAFQEYDVVIRVICPEDEDALHALGWEGMRAANNMLNAKQMSLQIHAQMYHMSKALHELMEPKVNRGFKPQIRDGSESPTAEGFEPHAN